MLKNTVPRTILTACCRGFTLVELLVAVVIIAILAAVAVPSFLADMPRRRLAEATRNLMSDMQWVRLRAVSTHWPCGIYFDLAANRYQLVNTGPNRQVDIPGDPDYDDLLIRTVNLADYGSGVRYGFGGGATGDWNTPPIAPGQQSSIAFNSRGLIVGAAGSTFLTNADDRIAYAITASPGGGLRLRMYNGVLPFDQNNWVEK